MRRTLAILLGGATLAVALGACRSTADSRAERRAAGRPAEQTGLDQSDRRFLRQYAETYRFRLGRPSSITPTPDGEAVLFLRSGPRSFEQDLYVFDVDTGRESVLLTAEDLLGGEEEQLTAEEKARRERMRQAARGVASFRLSEDGERLLIPLSGSLFLMERDSGEVRELERGAGFPIDPQFSPDATQIAYVVDGDLYVYDIASGEETRLTERPSEAISYGTAEFVAQEEMGRRHGYWWSPDGETLAYQETDESNVEVLRIMDPAAPEKPVQEWRYPRPGKTNASVRLGLMPASGGPTTWVQWDRERYPYLATVRWQENAPLTILVQNRTQTEHVLLEVDPSTGYTTRLLVEQDPAWINLDQDMPRWLPDGSGFLWTTEINGDWQLELRAPDGSLRRTLTAADFGYRDFVHYQEETGEAVVIASQDPTQAHGWRVPLDNIKGGPRRVTAEPGVHSAVFADDGFLHVHIYQTRDGERGYDVLGRGGEKFGELRSVAEEAPFDVNVQFTTVQGARTYDAAIIRPRDFEPGRRYPVILSVYGGPHGKMVMATPRRYVFNQWMADQGYIVAVFDGRGTPHRGRDWERAIKGDLISIPLEDQVEALRLAGDRFPEMDLDRVGVFGWSFGGYFSAHAVMQRPDVFDAGVAGAPVADWMDYDTHYTERYMGLPEENPEGYEAANVLTYAKDIEKPLLIIHGTADDNVYFMHGLKMAEALFRAGRPFEFVPLIGFTHMVTEPETTVRMYERIMRFFNERLREG